MTSMFRFPTAVSGPELAGIFPAYDLEAPQDSPRQPMRSSQFATPSMAAHREAAELTRIARGILPMQRCAGVLRDTCITEVGRRAAECGLQILQRIR